MTTSEVQLRVREAITRQRGIGKLPVVDAGLLNRRQRVAVYTHAYFARLEGVLRDDYPAVAQRIGEDTFRVLVKEFLQQFPPHHYSIGEAGARLPQFIKKSPVYLRHTPYLADLADFEWTLSRLMTEENCGMMQAKDLNVTSPEIWPSINLQMITASGVQCYDWPVSVIQEAILAGKEKQRWKRRRTRLIIWRNHEEKVMYRVISAVEYDVLCTMQQGSTLASLCTFLAEIDDEGTAVFSMYRFLKKWLEDGILADTMT